MGMAERIQFLRGTRTAPAGVAHPIVELTEAELRQIVGGNPTPQSKGTSSYSSSGAACCDGTKVCCI